MKKKSILITIFSLTLGGAAIMSYEVGNFIPFGLGCFISAFIFMVFLPLVASDF